MRKVIVFALLVVFLANPVRAAKFTWLKDDIPRLLIEGIIKPGDFEKFQSKLVEKKAPPEEFFLNSPGGDVREALKIGRLVRKLLLDTTVPALTRQEKPKKLICWIQTGRVEAREFKRGDECICASACFFIYVAGIYRRGNYVAVHRPYVNKTDTADISLKSYVKKYQGVKKEIRDYLSDMGVSDKWYEILISTPSHDARFLTEEETSEFLIKRPAEIEEWVFSKCSKLTPLERQMNTELWSKMERVEPLTKVEKIIFKDLNKKTSDEIVCGKNMLWLERLEVFFEFKKN